jgi:hypothetical protein
MKLLILLLIVVSLTAQQQGMQGMPGMEGQQGQTGGQQGPPGGGSRFTTGTTCDSKTKQLTINVNKSDTTLPGGALEITGDGCPGYDWTSQTTPNTAKQIFKTYKVPLAPVMSKNPYYVGIKGLNGVANTAVLEAVGVAANGVAIYANGDANNLDAYQNEGMSFDTCHGHPTQMSEYHYHMEPSQGCVYTDSPGKHSPLFGIMFDGVPFFGQYGDNGVAPTDLDECGGHVDKTHPYYHYHLPKDMKFPYTLTCLRGCIYNVNNNPHIQSQVKTIATCEKADKQYDYTSFYKDMTVTNGKIISPEASNQSVVTSTGSTNFIDSAYLSYSYLFSLLLVLLI